MQYHIPGHFHKSERNPGLPKHQFDHVLWPTLDQESVNQDPHVKFDFPPDTYSTWAKDVLRISKWLKRSKQIQLSGDTWKSSSSWPLGKLYLNPFAPFCTCYPWLPMDNSGRVKELGNGGEALLLGSLFLSATWDVSELTRAGSSTQEHILTVRSSVFRIWLHLTLSIKGMDSPKRLSPIWPCHVWLMSLRSQLGVSPWIHAFCWGT